MEAAVFERFRDIIYRKCGIVLSPEKKSLLASRIQRRLRERGLKSESEYLEVIELDIDGPELVSLIDAISTNTTYFWREPEHFGIFGKILSAYKAGGKFKPRIWCAASSCGQEPYTLAMQAMEHMAPPQYDVRILATDVSTRVLKTAQSGVYADQDVRKLPADLRSKYFNKVPDESGEQEDKWQVSKAVASLVLFKQLNLVKQPYPLHGPLDVIFCRNVMIYFDVATRQAIIDEFQRLLAPGGYLFLSLSESLLGIRHSLVKAGVSVYTKQT